MATNTSDETDSTLMEQKVNNDVSCPEKKVKAIPKFNPESLYYDMTGEKILIIFNHYRFQPTKYYRMSAPKQRNATHEDVNALKSVFGDKLGFKILTFTDLSHEDISETMSKIGKEDHSRTSCLAVVILTHGGKGGELFAADRPYSIKDIITPLEYGHSTLLNKPKLFFIQACRGDLADSGRTVEYDSIDENSLTIPSHADFLFMYSTVEEYLSWRDMRGSWFIQVLCEVIAKHHQDLDILQLMTITIRNVAYQYSSNTPRNKSTHNKKQTPEARFTLSKLVMLR